MSDQPAGDVASGTAEAWGPVLRAREPVAWALLVFTAVVVLVNVIQLFNLPGARLGIGPAPSDFAVRAALVTPGFVGALVIWPPVPSVVLVAFSGGVTEHARQVLKTAAVVQAAGLVAGVIGLAGAAGAFEPATASASVTATYFIFEMAGLAIVATLLSFTILVIRSPAVRSLAPRFEYLGDDGEDYEDDPDSGEHYWRT